MLALICTALSVCMADLGDANPPQYITNPIARIITSTVDTNTPTIITLQGFEASGLPLNYVIRSLPSQGNVYETSQTYRSFSSQPFNAPQAITTAMLPYQVTDIHARIVYIPPASIYSPPGAWGHIKYTAIEPVSNSESSPGYIVLANPDGYTASSSFLADCEGWYEESPGLPVIPLTYAGFTWGGLDRYCVGKDTMMNIDFDTGDDQAKWLFVAPKSTVFSKENIQGSYGGILGFTLRAAYGNFSAVNSGILPLVALECEACNSGQGLRLFMSSSFDGSQSIYRIPLLASAGWLKDPMNVALPYTAATECEVVAVLMGLSKLSILGDYTKAGEGVALDDIFFSAASSQPSIPITCMQGCACPNNSPLTSIWCCGIVATAK